MTDATFEEVETVDEDTEVVEPAAEEKKEEKKSKRPALPDGYGTPIQFAKALTEKLRAERKLGENEEFKPQVVYSYIRNKAKENPIPVVYVDPNGNAVDEPTDGYRPAFRKNDSGELYEAMAWWDEKEQRVAQRKANAAEKAAKKAQKATKSEAPAEEVVDAGEAEEVTEAE